LLFIHGFPSTSFNRSCQVAPFAPLVYGVFVPDCGGYWGTSTPRASPTWSRLDTSGASGLDLSLYARPCVAEAVNLVR
ncbi:uncharacterized protein BXZ73DRAFT_43265, partial [Epithele typhae]|uniref:uncharacterized protein n=1 Tax=Epithele typhae TaxID=378194 RepID=UPI0020083B56